MSLGSVFISHKHEDAELATVFGNFIEAQSLRRVQAFVSSRPEFSSTQGAEDLDGQIRNAIKQAGAMILIYTTPDSDWSYCMYECGLATMQSIKLHIFQFTAEEPPPFGHLVRYRACERDDIQRFANAYLTETAFLRDQKEAITHYPKGDKFIETSANQLFERLQEVFARRSQRKQEWIPWPHLRVKLSKQDFENIYAAESSQKRRIDMLKVALENSAVVSSVTPGFDQIVRVALEEGDPFRKLTAAWRTEYPQPDQHCSFICKQILTCYERKITPLRALYAQSFRGSYVLPVVSRALTSLASDEVEFDLQFYDIVEEALDETLIKRQDNQLVLHIPDFAAIRDGRFPEGTMLLGHRSTALRPIFGLGNKDWQWEDFLRSVSHKAGTGDGQGEDVLAALGQLPDACSKSIQFSDLEPIFRIFRSYETDRQFQPLIQRIDKIEGRAEVLIEFHECSVGDLRNISHKGIAQLLTALNLTNRFRWEVLDLFAGADRMKAAIAQDGGDKTVTLSHLKSRIEAIERESIERGLYDPRLLPAEFGEPGSEMHEGIVEMFRNWGILRIELMGAIDAGQADAVAAKLLELLPMNCEFLRLAYERLKQLI